MRRIGLAVMLTVGLILASLAADAQSPDKVPRIGYLVLSPLVDPPSAERQAFLLGLRELGYVVGQNIVIEYRRRTVFVEAGSFRILTSPTEKKTDT
jgi:hypothetical protein